MTNKKVLSSLNRSSTVAKLAKDSFDLVVIGGGITGAGIALDAASRGLKVALVEKNDFASGTSSRSTKLIHGGLRYLKQLEISLVREVGSERAIVHKLAPHLVTAEKMLLPLIEGGTYGKLSTSFGLMVYDFLAGVEGKDKRVMLSRKETLNAEPLLKKKVVKGGGLYAEYRTDDARLTIEALKKANEYGAISINYIKVSDFIYKKGKVVGVKCHDLVSDEAFDIKASYVVSATGPWVDELRKTNKSLKGKHLYLTKGVHLVVPYDKLPLEQAVYFDVPDGRMIFAIPRHRATYIGTTDTPYTEDINKVLTKSEDVDYLLEAVNNMFPKVNLKPKDVESSWAGLRPLIHEEGKSASELSRKDEIFVSDTNLISIAGGKLTGYRKMAERIVNLVGKKYTKATKKELKACHTDQIALTEKPFKNAKKVTKYTESLKERLKCLGLSDYYAIYLVANYGKASDVILQKFNEFNDDPKIALARAELWYTIQTELVVYPLDFFTRRTGRLYFNINSIMEVVPAVLADFKTYFAWTDQEITNAQQAIVQAIKEASKFEYSKSTKKEPAKVSSKNK